MLSFNVIFLEQWCQPTLYKINFYISRAAANLISKQDLRANPIYFLLKWVKLKASE